MDQKRILWIVAASGLFLLVVVGVALFLSAPMTQAQHNLETLQANGNTWIKGEVKNPTQDYNQVVDSSETFIVDTTTETPENTQPENQDKNDVKTINVDTVTLIAGTTNVYTQGTETQKESESAKTGTTITLNTVTKEEAASSKPATTTVTTPKVTPVTKPVEDCVEAPVKTTTPVSSSSASSTKTSTVSSTTTTSSSSVTQTKPVADQYWVQVASFTGKKNAEDARAALLEEKINSEIFTYKDNKGTVYYRLRVGPYTTKSEAEYWHSRIKLIEQFAGTSSYVVNSTGKAQN
jgi:cell division protein FtsN